MLRVCSARKPYMKYSISSGRRPKLKAKDYTIIRYSIATLAKIYTFLVSITSAKTQIYKSEFMQIIFFELLSRVWQLFERVYEN